MTGPAYPAPPTPGAAGTYEARYRDAHPAEVPELDALDTTVRGLRMLAWLATPEGGAAYRAAMGSAGT